MALNKPNNEIDTSALAQESTSQEIKLSNESIKAVADEILSRIGLPTDTGGGANTGTVLGKLNALFSAGGGGIKSVQRGIIEQKECNKRDTSFDNRYYTLVDLKTPINPEKSFLLIQNYAGIGSPYAEFNCIGRIYSSTQLALYGNYQDFIYYVFWEVVEFN